MTISKKTFYYPDHAKKSIWSFNFEKNIAIIKATMLFFSNIYPKIASVTFLTTGDSLKSTLKSYRKHRSFFFQNIAISGRFSKIQKIDFTLTYERARAHRVAIHFSNQNYKLFTKNSLSFSISVLEPSKYQKIKTRKYRLLFETNFIS